MFDFENLEVYKKAKTFNAIVRNTLLKVNTLDSVTKNQIKENVPEYRIEHCRRNKSI